MKLKNITPESKANSRKRPHNKRRTRMREAEHARRPPAEVGRVLFIHHESKSAKSESRRKSPLSSKHQWTNAYAGRCLPLCNCVGSVNRTENSQGQKDPRRISRRCHDFRNVGTQMRVVFPFVAGDAGQMTASFSSSSSAVDREQRHGRERTLCHCLGSSPSNARRYFPQFRSA